MVELQALSTSELLKEVLNRFNAGEGINHLSSGELHAVCTAIEIELINRMPKLEYDYVD